MTLVINEILERDNRNEYWLVAAADQRMWSLPDSRPLPPMSKLIDIPYLHGAVSFYGISEVPSGQSNRNQLLTDWLRRFIKQQFDCGGLEYFASRLREQLNRVIPPEWHDQVASGFHICGHDRENQPQFWHVCNHPDPEKFNYVNRFRGYSEPTFWTIKDKGSVQNRYGVIYWARNGQFLSHAAAWVPLDEVMYRLTSFPGFQRPDLDARTYGYYIKFKLEVISHIFKYWAFEETVGPPIDVLVFRSTKDGVERIEIKGDRPGKT